MANPNPELHPENLIPIKPGEVRNPNGSSQKQRFTRALVKLLDEAEDDIPFVMAGIVAAKAGDFNFWKYIWERIEGKIPEADPPAPEISMEEVAKRLKERKKAKRKKFNE